MPENITTKFDLVEKEQLKTMFLEGVFDAEMKLKRAKTYNSKRHLKRQIEVFGSAAAYLDELIKIKTNHDE